MQEDPHISRLDRAFASLEGVSVGDAFGSLFFNLPEIVEPKIERRETPEGVWLFTDDTMMALSVYNMLRDQGAVLPDLLAADFAARYDNTRGYGPTMHGLLADIAVWPSRWRTLAGAQFGGRGSFGNGSAMRVAPIGAYFADDLGKVAEQAELSSITTHTNSEAIAGAVAVAVGAAIAASLSGGGRPGRAEFLSAVIAHVPDSEVRARLRLARDMDDGASVRHAVAVLGNGVGISAQDTVPFSLWCAGERLDSYEEALWLTVSGLGDRDTTCAIVGGVVACYTGADGIPAEWRRRREPLPDWR
ncbi:hydrolase [Capsulimonas corticalis]|uniref:Hydrolase n=1 Tax=Capsulimonas corticalis TaxID=2219043 RepID=A0A402D2E3_9BACT|nr:ADP-ribosylglycohydrolase family protein [Capsulimonas corticalis]BDI30029.1 hydrolase [Capsulimonas corticalis]